MTVCCCARWNCKCHVLESAWVRMLLKASFESWLLEGHAGHSGGAVQSRLCVWAEQKLDLWLEAAGLYNGCVKKSAELRVKS